MKCRNNLLLFATSFLGGLAAGLLLAPQESSQNRTWLSKNATELGQWAKLQQRFARITSIRELSKIQRNITKGVQHHIPDLYEATDHIPLSKKDIVID